MDVEIFTQVLQRGLPRCRQIRSREHLDQVINEITVAIQKAIDDTVPTALICPRSIPGFTDECREALDQVMRAQRRYNSRPTDFDQYELQKAKHVRDTRQSAWQGAMCISDIGLTSFLVAEFGV
jgi:hypothetical protein